MLARCRRDQWRTEDLDWTRPPPAMSEDKEAAVVQAFTDMEGIERLAGALFAAQARRTTDPTLAAIFTSFVVDEERHAVVAGRLARHYDVRRLRRYAVSPARPDYRTMIDGIFVDPGGLAGDGDSTAFLVPATPCRRCTT